VRRRGLMILLVSRSNAGSAPRDRREGSPVVFFNGVMESRRRRRRSGTRRRAPRCAAPRNALYGHRRVRPRWREAPQCAAPRSSMILLVSRSNTGSAPRAGVRLRPRRRERRPLNIEESRCRRRRCGTRGRVPRQPPPSLLAIGWGMGRVRT